MRDHSITGGEADIAAMAALFADPTRVRLIMALSDGRALAATVLAGEAGVSSQATSSQLHHLLAAGLVEVEQSGRHRFYRLASERAAQILEALAVMSPMQPVRSLRESTRAAALRTARTCYDHLAGRLGVAVTQGLIDQGVLVATDGIASTARRVGDPLSSQLREHPYRLGPGAAAVLTQLGVPEERLTDRASRPLLRFCLDWSEQRRHLAGRLGREVLDAFVGAGWVVRRPRDRAVRLTAPGEAALAEVLHLPHEALV